MIPWKNFDVELPAVGSVVWLLVQHPKKNGPLACEIIGFRVREGTPGMLVADNEDECDRGWLMFVLDKKNAKDDDWKKERPLAWCEAKDIPFPFWAEQRTYAKAAP